MSKNKDSNENKSHNQSLSYYMDELKNIGLADKNHRKPKIAILSSSTIKGVKEVLIVKCNELGFLPDIHIGEYNQYNREILDDDSALYRFDPDLIVLFIDTRSLLGDAFFDYYSLSAQEQSIIFDSKKDHINTLISKMKSKVKAKIVVHNFEVPEGSSFGILENKQPLGIVEFIEKLNSNLRDMFKRDPQVFVFDYNGFISNIGKKEAFNYKMYYLADIKIDLNCLPILANQYMAYIKPLMSMSKKCIVLDLDNTLWGGVVAEDGIEGIKLGPTPEGRPFVEFQKYILSLYNRGIILAINSKNNPDDALEIFKKHPHMILKEKQFSSVKINWDDKISNMKSIAKEINIGLDSIVFFDDDKVNREMIKYSLPQVKVVDMPEDSSLYLQTIKELDDFNMFYITEEDIKKGQMYAQQKQREEFSRSVKDYKEYLKGLEIKATIQKADKFSIPRISQLTQKTNQFNLTTRRYLEEDIKKFSSDADRLVFSVKVEDKYGDNGITGTAIIIKKEKKWIIDVLLLSCRIIGRNVEDVMLAYIIEAAQKKGIEKILGQFVPTKKNEPAKDFFSKSGFVLTEKNEHEEKWEYDVSKGFPYPKFIKILKEK